MSLIDSWFLCRSPIKKLLLRIMRKSKHDESNEPKRQIVYSFGDHYYFRKELKILNLLTGYKSSLLPLNFMVLWIVGYRIILLTSYILFMLPLYRYIFLLDKFGRIRWQGSGLATEEESSSLLSCAKLLLEDKWGSWGSLHTSWGDTRVPNSRMLDCSILPHLLCVFCV